MRYVTDNMLNRLAKELPKAGIDCITAIQAIRGDNDSSKKIPDAKIFKFLLEKRYELRAKTNGLEEIVLITSDKSLAKFCQEFNVPFIYRGKPDTRKGFRDMTTKLIEKLQT